MDFFETTCGHYVCIRPVQKVGGPKEGKWQLRVSGPTVTLPCGFKRLYSEPNLSSVNDTVAAYLGVDVADLRKPLTRPRILLGLDVETSDWDEQCSFTRQDEHFEITEQLLVTFVQLDIRFFGRVQPCRSSIPLKNLFLQ